MRIATLKEIEKALENELNKAENDLARCKEVFRIWESNLDKATYDETISSEELETIKENYGYYRERKKFWLDRAEELRSALEDFRKHDWR